MSENFLTDPTLSNEIENVYLELGIWGNVIMMLLFITTTPTACILYT